MLADELSPRQSATDEELAAAKFFAGKFSEWGYDVELQEFDVVDRWAATRLVLLTPDVVGYGLRFYEPNADGALWAFATPIDRASFAPEGYSVRGSLVYAGSGAPDDLAGVDLMDKIALLGRGGLPLEDKVDAVAGVGAAAAVIFNDAVDNMFFVERINRQVVIPSIGISRDHGLALVEALGPGANIEVEVLKLPLVPQPSRNVVAELNNDINGDQVLVIGAHYDTTPGSPGANDNGSGLAVVTVLAQELADDAMPFDLRFVLFGSEETGLNGSFHYVQELGPLEESRVMAVINLDVVGTGCIGAVGSERLLELANAAADAIDIDLAIVADLERYGSDHLPFLYAGIEILLIFADDFTYINSPEDTLERLQPEPMAQSAAIVLDVVERLSGSSR